MFVVDGARHKILDMERTRFMEKEWPRVLGTIKRLGFSADELLKNNLKQEGS